MERMTGEQYSDVVSAPGMASLLVTLTDSYKTGLSTGTMGE